MRRNRNCGREERGAGSCASERERDVSLIPAIISLEYHLESGTAFHFFRFPSSFSLLLLLLPLFVSPGVCPSSLSLLFALPLERLSRIHERSSLARSCICTNIWIFFFFQKLLCVCVCGRMNFKCATVFR